MHIHKGTKRLLFLLSEVRTKQKLRLDKFYIVKKYGIFLFLLGPIVHRALEKLDTFLVYQKWIYDMKKLS